MKILKYTLILSIFFVSSAHPYKSIVNPIQCYNNPYIDKVLDSLRYEESRNNINAVGINYKNGVEDSRDEGPYQLNNKNHIYYANKYNDGRRYNSFNEEISRKIARQILIDNYTITGNWLSALAMYNCGVRGWRNNPPIKSIRYAERILRRIKEEQRRNKGGTKEEQR
jgi:hypothetical protein